MDNYKLSSILQCKTAEQLGPKFRLYWRYCFVPRTLQTLDRIVRVIQV